MRNSSQWSSSGRIQTVFLHALPFGGAIWDDTRAALPVDSIAPDLYPFGSDLGAWADGVLELCTGDELLIVGCSVGASCAFEILHRAPERVGALVIVDDVLGAAG